MSRIWDEMIEDAVRRGGERIAMNLVLRSKMTDSKIEEYTEVPAERIEELRKGVALIGKDILELQYETIKKSIVSDVVCINKKFNAGETMDEIINYGYSKELVEQVYQDIFSVNRIAEVK